MVFAVPLLSGALGGASISKTVTALVFVMGTCFGLLQTIPILSAANAAAANIGRLEVRLLATVADAQGDVAEPARRFEQIEMHDIVFSYVEKSTETVFKVGPVDFTLRSGELVFITGGNGSGKSTFLKLLASLYKPDSGGIFFDGILVSRHHARSLSPVDQLRSLSTIISSSGCMGSPIQTPSKSIGSWRSFDCWTRPASRTGSLTPSTCRPASASASP